MAAIAREQPIPRWKLLLTAIAAVAVHGYHLGVDDAEIYIPAIKKVADPTLFPFPSSEFFSTHARFSLSAASRDGLICQRTW